MDDFQRTDQQWGDKRHTRRERDKQSERYDEMHRTCSCLTLFSPSHHLRLSRLLFSLSLSTSFSFPLFLPISGKNSNYISELAEALVNDWKRGKRGSGQPNKIQWAESLYCHRVCVSGRQEETNNLCPSVVFSVLSLVSFFRLIPSPWSQRTKLNYKLQVPPWNLALALLQLSLKDHEGTKRLCRLTSSLSCGLSGQMAWPETLSGVVVSQAAKQTHSLFVEIRSPALA